MIKFINFLLTYILKVDCLSFTCCSEFSRTFRYLTIYFSLKQKSTCQKITFQCGQLRFYKLNSSFVIKHNFEVIITLFQKMHRRILMLILFHIKVRATATHFQERVAQLLGRSTLLVNCRRQTLWVSVLTSWCSSH